MKSYVYKKVDAFTSGFSRGNPAAFMELGDDCLTEAEMLAIAREHQGFVSEFVFVSRQAGRMKLAYYSSECEVAFCGHGTIAVMHELILNDRSLLGMPEIEIETNKKGSLTVYNRLATDNAVFITAPDVLWLKMTVAKSEIAEALNISESALATAYPIDFVDAGLRTLIVPIATLQDEIEILPDKDILERFCIVAQIDIILIFSMETAGAKYFAHTRVFAPKFGYLEDPATGSGNSAFGYYLIKNKLWAEGQIAIEQGGSTMIYNEVKLMRLHDKVLFGGQANRKIDGKYYL